MSSTALRFLQHENARLQEQNKALQEENQALRRYVHVLKDLYQATEQIISEENLLELLDQILYNAMNVLNAEGGSLLLRDEETDELVFVLVHGDVGHKLRGYRMKGDTGIAGWVATHHQPLIVNNPRQDRRFSGEVDRTFGYITRSILCVPMIARSKLIGVIQVLNKRDSDDFIDADANLLAILGYVAAIALQEMQTRLDAEEEAAEMNASASR